MKDKLRELAEMVREAYRAGFIAACKWPEPVSQDVDSSAYNKEFNAWSFSVREKHAAILDAEGDGGAVPAELFAWLTARDLVPDLDEDGSFDMHLLIEALNEHENELQTTHPARSGVVSDEDVSVVAKMIADRIGNGMREKYEDVARKIVEHFAAIAQEKQS